MIELSNRCIAIVQMLLKEHDYVRSQDIADYFNVSVRTVKYDMDKIRWWMKDNGFELLSSPKRGIKISEDNRKEIEEYLNHESGDYFFNSKDRISNMIYFLLCEYSNETIDEMAEMMDISRNTVLRDLDKAEQWFMKHGSAISRRQKKGIVLKLSENEIRRLLVECVTEQKNIDDTIEYYAFKTGLYELNPKLTEIEKKISAKADIDFIISFLESFKEKYSYHISDVNMVYLIYFISVQFFRIGQRHYVKPEFVLYSKEFETVFEQLCECEELIAKLHLPSVRTTIELKYFAKIIYAYIDKMNIDEDNYSLTEAIYNDLVLRVYEITHCDISMDIDVAKAMKLHISSMINRLDMKVPYHNVMLKDIKEKYADSFNLANEIFKEISEKYHISNYEDEIGFIALYINQALERIFKDTGNYHYVNTLLICSQGQARVTYLVKSLQERFNRIKIVDKVSVFKLNGYDYSNVDLILTTIDIPFKVLKPVIKVDPILSKRNIDKIEMFLSENIGSSYSQGNKELLVNEVIRIVGQYYDVETNFRLKEDLRILIGSDSKPLPNLVQVLKGEYIVSNIDAYDWEDAVVQSAEPLLKAGMIDGRYLEEIFEMKNRDGQYALVTNGICLPHASPNSRNRLSMSLATLRKPISIPCDDGYADVSVVMVLAINDNIRYSKAVDELFTLFSTYPDFAKILCTAKSNKELKEIIRNCYDKVDW